MPHKSDRIKSHMLENAVEITRLQTRINDKFAQRDRGQEQRNDWSQACDDFHNRYDQLAFPGGYGGALDRIRSGDSETIENALCFLEARPYFFRSGYMYKDILRVTKQASLEGNQAARLQSILQAIAAWRARKDSPNGA